MRFWTAISVLLPLGAACAGCQTAGQPPAAAMVLPALQPAPEVLAQLPPTPATEPIQQVAATQPQPPQQAASVLPGMQPDATASAQLAGSPPAGPDTTAPLVLPALRVKQDPSGGRSDLPAPRTLDRSDDKPEPGDKEKDKEAKPDGEAKPAETVAVPSLHGGPPAQFPFGNRCRECSALNCLFANKVPAQPLPKELHLTVSPPYVIGISDILLVESPRSLPDQPIAGNHLVKADGKISLGLYGEVKVAGLTVEEARQAIVKQLEEFIREPKVNVDVYAYNSKYYYVIFDNAGYGETVQRINYTGNDTLLDALSLIGGIPATGSKRRIWIARPNRDDEKCGLVLPVDYNSIVKCGQTATNYQLFPNDRIYIQSERLQAVDGLIAKITSPIERVFGTGLLSIMTVTRGQNMGRQVTGTAAVVVPGGGF